MVAAAVVAPAAAQSPDPGLFEARATSLYIQSGQAEVVGMCGIRSNDWVNNIDTNVAIAIRMMGQKSGIDPVQESAIEKRAYANSRPRNPTSASCQALVNSDLVAKLDQLQFTLSGGYH
jgi:hypothetical protein